MTDAPTIERETLWVTDAEIAERWGVCDKVARRAIKAFAKAGGFPRRDPLFGGKRYWPAVVAFTDDRAKHTIESPSMGQENWDGQARTPRRRTRSTLAPTN